MVRLEELDDAGMMVFFLTLDFIDLIVMKGVCKRLRDFLQSPDFMRSYNERGRRMIWNHTHFCADRRSPNPHKVISIREEDGIRVCFRLNQLRNENLQLMNVWKGMLVFHYEGYGFLIYNLWTGIPLRIYCSFFEEMRNFNAMQIATKLTLAPDDVLRYVISSVHFVHRRQRRPLLRFFSYTHQDYPAWASSALVNEVLTANELNHSLRRIIPISRERRVAVVSLRGRRAVHFIREGEDIFGESFENEYRTATPRYIGYQYSKEFVYGDDGYLAVLEKLRGIHTENAFIFRVKLFKVEPNLEGGYQFISKVPREYIPQDFNHFTDSFLKVVEGEVNLTMKRHSPPGRPRQRSYVVLRYIRDGVDAQRRPRWVWVTKGNTFLVPSQYGYCGGTFSCKHHIMPALID